MGKKSQASKQAQMQLGKHPENVTPRKSRQKKFRFKTIKSNNPNENLKKIVSNFKRPKDEVSGNWQAFLASGLGNSSKSQDKISNKQAASVSEPKLKKKSTAAFPAKTVTVAHRSENVAYCGSPSVKAEEVYISELDPKSEEEKHEMTRCIAMDCEMVGVFDGKESVLARVSLVNQHGECLYDQFVKPKEKVADYRTKVSGIRPSDLKRGKDFETVQKEVADLLNNKVLVGHALKNDLKVLMLNHPPKMVRDTSRFKPFRNVTKGRTPALKKLASELLGVSIQTGEHSSVEDAKAAMQLYNLYQKEWEDHRLHKKVHRRKNSIAAALGKTTVSVKNKKNSEVPKNSLFDEFAAF